MEWQGFVGVGENFTVVMPGEVSENDEIRWLKTADKNDMQ